MSLNQGARVQGLELIGCRVSIQREQVAPACKSPLAVADRDLDPGVAIAISQADSV